MLEEILMSVVNAMSGSLDEEQLDKLQNILYINFHNIKVVEEKNELQATGTDGDTVKMRLFVASKKVSGRQDNTLTQYIREITNCRNALQKNFEDITTMDLRWYFGMLRERNKISMVTLQGRMRYLNSFWTFLQKENLVKDNPVSRIESLRIESTIKKAFSAQELEALRMGCEAPRERALIESLFNLVIASCSAFPCAADSGSLALSVTQLLTIDPVCNTNCSPALRLRRVTASLLPVTSLASMSVKLVIPSAVPESSNSVSAFSTLSQLALRSSML